MQGAATKCRPYNYTQSIRIFEATSILFDDHVQRALEESLVYLRSNRSDISIATYTRDIPY
jgi:hypothetical protein